jgi:hypothetical protein
VLLLLLELLARGYRVCISAHSPHVLDVVWALKAILKHQAVKGQYRDRIQCNDTRRCVAQELACASRLRSA